MQRILACRKLTVFVAATADFEEHPKVANGASDLIIEILGDVGKHSRSAVGVASLPFNAPVEVEAVFDVKLT
jgi:enamine deaminase RidA (YjgF/YER057c/UK114 family)